MNELTIQSILETKQSLQGPNQGQNASSSSNLQTPRERSSTMVEIKRLLLIWIEDLCQIHFFKALILFNTVEKAGVEMEMKRRLPKLLLQLLAGLPASKNEQAFITFV